MEKIMQVALILISVFIFTEASALEAQRFTLRHGGMERERPAGTSDILFRRISRQMTLTSYALWPDIFRKSMT